MGELLRDLIRGAGDLLWPRACYVCDASLGGTREPWLCGSCRATLPLFGDADPLCHRCARILGPVTAEGGCPDCRSVSPRFEAVRAAGAYRGPLRRLVTGLKYAHRPSCAWPLGALLAARLEEWGPLPRDAVVVSFPSSKSARRRRGFDPPALLADEVAAALRLPRECGVLRRVGNPEPQASLPRSERIRAPKGSVEVVLRSAVRGRAVLLVDDVLTTGATASEAARVLLAAGAARVLVAVAARA